MRTMFVLVIIIFATAAKAQTLLPVSFAAYKQMQANGRRLPWHIAEQALVELEQVN